MVRPPSLPALATHMAHPGRLLEGPAHRDGARQVPLRIAAKSAATRRSCLASDRLYSRAASSKHLSAQCRSGPRFWRSAEASFCQRPGPPGSPVWPCLYPTAQSAAMAVEHAAPTPSRSNSLLTKSCGGRLPTRCCGQTRGGRHHIVGRSPSDDFVNRLLSWHFPGGRCIHPAFATK